MRIFDRYIFGSVFATTFGAVLLLAFVMIAGNLLKDLLALAAAGHLPGWATFKLILLVLPKVLSHALPMGFLAGLLISFGRMSADQEITAMKCAGVSLWRLAVPALVVGLIGTGIAALSNCYLGPKSQLAYRDTIADMLKADPASFLAERVVINQFPGFVLYVGKREGEKLSDFWVWELDENKNAKRILRSRTGTFRFDSERAALVLSLQGAFFEIRGSGGLPGAPSMKPGSAKDGGGSLAEFKQIELELPLDRLLGGGTAATVKRNSLTQSELADKIDEARATLAAVPADKKAERKAAESDLSKYVVRWHRNLAMALCVLPMGILALPLSLKTNRRETYVNAALALGLGLGYYLMMTLAESLQGKPSLYPEILIWLPNIGFLLLGLRLMRRASFH